MDKITPESMLDDAFPEVRGLVYIRHASSPDQWSKWDSVPHTLREVIKIFRRANYSVSAVSDREIAVVSPNCDRFEHYLRVSDE